MVNRTNRTSKRTANSLVLDGLVPGHPKASHLRIYFGTLAKARPRPTVLLIGETGTGKTSIAYELHSAAKEKSEREGELMHKSMAEVTTTLAESALFGHAANAFTGAKKAAPGIFEIAGAGTLFLDEINHLPTSVQAKLLVAIETRKYRRVGEEATQRDIDCWIIAATTAPDALLPELYERLAQCPIPLLPLRARPEDVFRKTARRLAVKTTDAVEGQVCVEDSTLKWLYKRDWPGNVRELESLFKTAWLFCDEPDTKVIRRKDIELALEMRDWRKVINPSSAPEEAGPSDGFDPLRLAIQSLVGQLPSESLPAKRRIMHEFARAYLEKLANKKLVCERLGLGSAHTLNKLLLPPGEED